MSVEKALEKAVERLERRKKNTQKGIKEFVEVWNGLKNLIESRIADNFDFKTDCKPFLFRQEKITNNGRVFVAEYWVIPAIFNGELVLLDVDTELPVKVYSEDYIKYVGFKGFIQSLKEFLNALSSELKTYEEEVKFFESLKEAIQKIKNES